MSYALDHKLPRFHLLNLTNRHPDFYSLVGPFLSRREIVGELGTPVWDDDDKKWTVAQGSDDFEVYGVLSVKRNVISSLYVVPGHRGQMVATTMLLKLLQGSEKKLRAHATPVSVVLFQEVGFDIVGKRGKYTVMEWEP